MNLLAALAAAIKGHRGVTKARLSFFAISDDTEEVAFLTEMPVAELVPLMERWCAERRAAGDVNRSTN